MFKWLEKRAAKQSLFNVQINTQTLIAVSNRADAAIAKTSTTNPYDMKAVASAQHSLLTDIELALANGATLSEVEQKITEARSREPVISAGAEKAIKHVLDHVVITRENETKSAERGQVICDYGSFLEHNPTSGEEIRDVRSLPHYKEKILDAICLEIVRESDANRREHLKVGALLLADFQEGVGEEPLHKLGFDIRTDQPSLNSPDEIKAFATRIADAAEGPNAERYEKFAMLASRELEAIRIRLAAAEKIGNEMPEAKKREILG